MSLALSSQPCEELGGAPVEGSHFLQERVHYGAPSTQGTPDLTAYMIGTSNLRKEVKARTWLFSLILVFLRATLLRCHTASQ